MTNEASSEQTHRGNISKRDLVLLLLGVTGRNRAPEPIGGITRLQKYLYILEKEEGVLPSGSGFDFVPYKAGPYSKSLYDDLEFLENLGFVESHSAARATEPEASDVAEFSFNELMGPCASSAELGLGFPAAQPDESEERRFKVTGKGLGHMKNLLSGGRYKPFVDGIRRVKSRFGSYSLSDLLYYVYTKYPEMAVESEIKDRVLRRRGRP